MIYNQQQSPEDNLSRILKIQNESGITHALFSGAEPLGVLISKVAVNALSISDDGAIEPAASESEASGGGGLPAAVALTGTTLAENVVSSSLTSFGAGISVLKVATVTLTDAQIKALPTTPVLISAAPGAGKINHFISGIWILNSEAGAYTNLDGGSCIGQFGINTSFQASPYDENDQGAFGSEGVAVIQFSPQQNVSTSSTLASWLGSSGSMAPIDVSFNNGGAGNFTGGHADNTLKVTAWYVEVEV